jgi:hypothetical protein
VAGGQLGAATHGVPHTGIGGIGGIVIIGGIGGPL